MPPYNEVVISTEHYRRERHTVNTNLAFLASQFLPGWELLAKKLSSPARDQLY